jgi:hypothetical protein
MIGALPGSVGGNVSKDLGGLLEATNVLSCKRYTIPMLCLVHTEEEYYPATGVYATQEKIPGWRWDRTIPQRLEQESARINTSIGAHLNFEEGLVDEDWLACTVGGLQVEEVKELQLANKRLGWFPSVDAGVYNVFGYEKRMYGDFSSCKLLTGNTWTIPEYVSQASISISVYKRNNNFINIPFIKYEYDESLAKNYSFKIENDSIKLKEVLDFKVGSLDLEEPDCHYETLGLVNSDRNIAYTRFFPVKDIKVFEETTSGEFTQLEKVNKFTNSPQTKEYILEKETGKILFNTKTTKTKIVSSAQGNVVSFYESLEDILEEAMVGNFNYLKRDNYSIYIKDENHTIVAGNTLEFKGVTETVSKALYVAYEVAPRIEFSVAGTEEKLTSKKDIKAYSSIDGSGIISLRVNERHISSITLTCDKALIGDFSYKTLFVGNDSTNLTATVKDSAGNLIEEAKVFFESNIGVFDSFNTSVTRQTNLAGECYVNFSIPKTTKVLEEILTNPEAGDVYTLSKDIPAGVSLEDISVFQILKTDPFYGSLGTQYSVASHSAPNKRVTVSEDILDPEDYISYQANLPDDEYYEDNLSCQKVYSNYGLAITKKQIGLNTITKKYIIEDIKGRDIYLSNSASFDGITSITLFKKGELQFNPNNDNWLERLAYYKEGDVYKKVAVTEINKNKIKLNKTLPPASMTNTNNLIAGYKIHYPQYYKLQAYAIDPATGNKIYSNNINILTDFPGYLKGSTGFKFKTTGNDSESGLGGSNFITINPTQPYQLNFLIGG